MNQVAIHQSGYSFDELIQSTAIDIETEFTADSFASLLTPLLNRQQLMLHYETMQQRKDGANYAVEVYLQLINYQSKTAIVALVEDISDRKQALKSLTESKRMLQRVLDTIPVPVF